MAYEQRIKFIRAEEKAYLARGQLHLERGEWVAANRASDVCDYLRYYRLHLESLDEAALQEIRRTEIEPEEGSPGDGDVPDAS